MADHVTRKSFKSLQRDKPKHSIALAGMKNHGGAKKGGAGGKGTWGRPGDELNYDEEIDSHDPNYDDDLFSSSSAAESSYPPHDWQPASHRFASSLEDFNKFKTSVIDAAREYIVSHEEKEFINVLRELSLPIYNSEIPHILFKYGLSVHASDREHLATLIRHLRSSSFLTVDQVAAGIRKLYNHLDDLTVDAPDARVLLREFATLLVAGGALEKPVLDSLEKAADSLKDQENVEKIKKQMDECALEFFESVDLDDVVKSIQEWNSPHLNFQFVKKLLSHAFDRGNRERELASRLLVELTPDIITREDVATAFSVLLERVEDLVLDVPDIFRLLSSFIARAVVDEVIPPAFLVRVDLAERDSGFQVIQQAQALLKEANASQRMARVWADREIEEQKKKAAKNPPAPAPAEAPSTTEPATVSNA